MLNRYVFRYIFKQHCFNILQYYDPPALPLDDMMSRYNKCSNNFDKMQHHRVTQIFYGRQSNVTSAAAVPLSCQY